MKNYYLKLLPPAVPKPIKLATFTCERCGKQFQKEFWYIKKGRRFCSHACRRQDPLKKLLSMVIKQENGCWDYKGGLDGGGYGQIKVGKTTWLTHRLMWTLWNQKRIPEGLIIRHSCIGNRKCINPDHLLIGTQQDNIDDMKRQGRFRTASPARRVFSDEIVREMRRIRQTTNMSYKKMSKLFKTGGGAIWQIVNLKTYRDVK